MLNRMQAHVPQPLNSFPSMQGLNHAPQQSLCEDRFMRNEREDMKAAIDALYEFKKKLSELHPNCTDFLENMLQQQRRY